ncbi:M60 family metallopeptidase [Paenibacillus aestuarii]|uniref:M60 family metallopeptidase n=1 Tax=Paenibacillus aestuarii TaxID=516965 RepID=A0ABW0KGM4_9BACL|nr:M60 family metallopeptidase [Paenibacillus aestuarii]
MFIIKRDIKALYLLLIVTLFASTIMFIPVSETKAASSSTATTTGVAATYSLPIVKANLTANQIAQFSNVTLDPTNVKSPYADQFPGVVPDSAPRLANQVVTVNFDYLDLSYLRMDSPPGTWVSTGLYAPAGSVITVNVPLGTDSLDVQIGSHTDNLVGLDTWNRPPVVVGRQTLLPGINNIVSPFGGLIYLIPTKSKPSTKVDVSISGAVKAPYFVLGQTTDTDWKNTIRNYQVPWAELQSNRVILTVPTSDILTLDSPSALMAKWDEIINSYDALVGISPDQPRPNLGINRQFRYVADIQISAGWMHSGYPIMYYQGDTSKQIVDINAIQHDGWGFWHELGHNYQQNPWEWSQVVEVTTNLHSLHVQLEYGNPSYLANGTYTPALAFVNSTSPTKNFNDDTQIDVWSRLVMFYQLKNAYGWDFYTRLHTAYRAMASSALPTTDQAKIDTFVVTASQTAGENLLGFFSHWGLKYSAMALNAVNALGLPQPALPIWNLTDDKGQPQTIAQSLMSATATSQETAGANNVAANVLDGNSSTIWHTKWDLSNPLPQSITLNLGGNYNINALKYLPRQDGSNHGNITAYNVYTSNDCANFTLVTSGTWADDATVKTANFALTNASYVKLEATAGDGGWASASELNVYYKMQAVANSALPFVVPHSKMTATATSYQTGNEATNAIDNNASTLWHTKWDLSNPLPQSITLNLGGSYNVSALEYLPRQDWGSNGIITAYNVYTSTDGVNFTKVTSGSWANDGLVKTATFAPTTASYVKLEATAGVGGYASAAEMNVYYTP